MRKIITLSLSVFFCGFMLAGCSYLHTYKPDIQQGNIVSKYMVNKLHLGMSPARVKQIFGNPVLQNTFADNRMNYVYTYQPGNKTMTLRQVVLTFKNNRLIGIQERL